MNAIKMTASEFEKDRAKSLRHERYLATTVPGLMQPYGDVLSTYWPGVSIASQVIAWRAREVAAARATFPASTVWRNKLPLESRDEVGFFIKAMREGGRDYRSQVERVMNYRRTSHNGNAKLCGALMRSTYLAAPAGLRITSEEDLIAAVEAADREPCDLG